MKLIIDIDVDLYDYRNPFPFTEDERGNFLDFYQNLELKEMEFTTHTSLEYYEKALLNFSESRIF